MRWGEGASAPFLSSCVLEISFFAPAKKLALATPAMIGYDGGPTLERLCACQSTERTWRGRTRVGGDKVWSVLHWFARDAQERAPAQIPNHDKFVDAKTTLWPSLTLRRTKVHLDSCSLTIAHTLLPRDQCDLLSLDDLNHNDHPPPPPPLQPFFQPTLHFCRLYRRTYASRIVLAGHDACLFSALE